MSSSAPADPTPTRAPTSASTSVFGGSASVNAPGKGRDGVGASASSSGGAGRSSSFVGGTSDPEAQAPKRRRGWIFSVSYYQQFFDVDTDDVGKRIANVFLSPHRGNFLEEVVGDNPDLYVPVWGCATLIFFIALGSAWGKYNIHKNQAWDFDAKTVSLSAAIIYGYVFVFSLMVYLMLSCYARVENLRVVDVWCLYGYSVLTLIPVCILATVRYELFRWIFFGACAALSTVFLMSNVRNRVAASSKGTAFAMSFVSFIGSANFLFALVLKLFFFQYYIGH